MCFYRSLWYYQSFMRNKKEWLSYRKKSIEEFMWGTSLFWLHALLSMTFCCFLPLLLPHFQVTLWMAFCVTLWVTLWVVFCVMISWVNGRKYVNLLQFNTKRFFYKQPFFSTHPQCCVVFSWIELQILLRCYLFLFMSRPRSIYVAYIWPIFHFQTDALVFLYNF